MGRTGRLVLVVGPSGVGKDSVLYGALAALQNDPDVVFPRRVVTRAPGLGGEDYIPATESDFAAQAQRGDFALYWPAHGLHYGIPKSIESDLAAGRQVVVNVSRGSIDEARRKYPGLLVIGITASPEVLRRRLEQRGREGPAEIEERLSRAAAFRLQGDDVAILNNDGALNDTVQAFLALLQKRG